MDFSKRSQKLESVQYLRIFYSSTGVILILLLLLLLLPVIVHVGGSRYCSKGDVIKNYSTLNLVSFNNNVRFTLIPADNT